MESVLVTGANGQLGVALQKMTDGMAGFAFYFTDVDTLDICDSVQVDGFIRQYNIGIIVNCAAYTAVDMSEDEPAICARINCDAVRSIGEVAASAGARVIHISTDYVFDGRGDRPYRETDATCPVSVYGATKLAGEQALMEACKDSIIVRTAWLYSETGKNFVKTMLRIGKECNRISVVTDQYGTPTYAGDLAAAIITLLTANFFIPGVYHFTNEGECTWYQFALKIIELAGIKCEVNPIPTAEYPTRATRPAYSVLDKSKIKETYALQIPSWEESLAKCLQHMEKRSAVSPYAANILLRRTFAVISHPDAGKTTLTEKLLLFGGAIHVAGAVKSNKIRRTATSDWMEIEKQRGISVATSVMAFGYEGFQINILDTPGHQDFAEDTYRTLTAVDSVIIVIDAAKGVEMQTRKLMEVCRMRKTPVIVFINKMDREGKDPFDLLDEIEAELQIHVRPLTWPVDMGQRFKGVYNLFEQKLDLYTPAKQTLTESIEIRDIAGDELAHHINAGLAEKLRADLELINGVYPTFDANAYLCGDMAPVFFGSALNNFGVRELLNCFIRIAPSPRPVQAVERMVEPGEDSFSGFVFKIHANMDPNHRSCIAFVKICSGRFERNVSYRHVRYGKMMRFSSPTAFMAQKKEVVDEAFAGDVIGLPDTGNFKIGDSLTAGEDLHFKGLPSFSPELFKYIENADPMKAKQLHKGIEQLMDEGVAQLFINQFNGRRIIGTVGQLQFEVIQFRLLNEYGAQCRWEPVSLYKACWIESDDTEALERFRKRKTQYMAFDRDGREVYLADSAYVLTMAQQDFPSIRFHFTSEI